MLLFWCSLFNDVIVVFEDNDLDGCDKKESWCA